MFIGRTDVETVTTILWPPDVQRWLIGKAPDARKDRRWEKKGMTEDEMVGCHHCLNGHELGLSWWWPGKPGVLQSWDLKESDPTEWLNWQISPEAKCVGTELRNLALHRFIWGFAHVFLLKSTSNTFIEFTCDQSFHILSKDFPKILVMYMPLYPSPQIMIYNIYIIREALFIPFYSVCSQTVQK